MEETAEKNYGPFKKGFQEAKKEENRMELSPFPELGKKELRGPPPEDTRAEKKESPSPRAGHSGGGIPRGFLGSGKYGKKRKEAWKKRNGFACRT